jgi:hypothetical protein
MKKLISITLVAGLTFGLAATLTGCPQQGGGGGTSPSPATTPAASPSPS